mgnify:CR=1 FL=1
MTMKGQNLGTEFRLYSKSKGADWKGLENFMKNNSDFSIKNISKQTFDNPKSIDFSYKTAPINESQINEVLQNDDLIYDRMSDMDQEQLVSMIFIFC